MRFSGTEIRTYLPKPQAATLVVAANDSLYKERADYICDGTADNVEIQAAINALPATGGGIFLLDGTFNITSQITIPNNNITITGVGKSTILSISSNINTIYATGKSGILIKDLYITGTGTGVGIKITSVSDSMIENCTIDTVDYGIQINGTNIIINKNRINNVTSNGIYLITGASCIGCKIINNYITSSGVNGIQIFSNINNLIISENKITNNGANGIQIFSFSIIRISISHNYISDNTNNGIYGFGSSIYELMLSDNIFYNNTGDGIIIEYTNGENCIISNNLCRSNFYNGMDIIIDKTIIIGNMCVDNDFGNTNTYCGIYVNGNRNLISNNICRSTLGTDKQIYGVIISGFKNKVFGNMLYQNKTGAINDAGTNTEIDHNQTIA